MSRPIHSALRDRAYGRFYARNGAVNIFAQAEQGGITQKADNVLRVAAWVNKRAKLPVERTLKTVALGADVTLWYGGDPDAVLAIARAVPKTALAR